MIERRARQIASAVLIVAACLLARHDAIAQATPTPLGGLSLEKKQGKISVLIDGEVFTEYVYTDTPKPYLYPIVGPTGAKMTRNYPMVQGIKGEQTDHPHHRSMWFAHGSVNGYDLWAEGKNKGTTITSAEPEAQITGGLSADISTRNKWLAPDGKEIGSDRTTIRVSHYSDKSRVIDYITVITAQPDKPLVFGDTKEGMMAMRVHPAIRLKGEVATGHAINSAGDKDLDVWGKRAKWVAYWGQIDGKTCGVAIFDSPENLRHPTWWHARDYGLVAANPFGIHDFEKKPKGTGDYTLQEGQQLILRYRFVFFEGTPQDADIAGKYKFWAEPKAPASEPTE